MAAKEIDLKQYSDNFFVRLRIWENVTKRGWTLRSALIVEGIIKTNFNGGPPSGAEQPLLWEEKSYGKVK